MSQRLVNDLVKASSIEGSCTQGGLAPLHRSSFGFYDPTPEPSAWALGGLGAVLLFLFDRKIRPRRKPA